MEGKEGLKRGALQFGREVPALPGDKIRVASVLVALCCCCA